MHSSCANAFAVTQGMFFLFKNTCVFQCCLCQCPICAWMAFSLLQNTLHSGFPRAPVAPRKPTFWYPSHTKWILPDSILRVLWYPSHAFYVFWAPVGLLRNEHLFLGPKSELFRKKAFLTKRFINTCYRFIYVLSWPCRFIAPKTFIQHFSPAWEQPNVWSMYNNHTQHQFLHLGA